MMNMQHLPNQMPGETVQLVLRRHWIAVVKIIVLTVALLAVPVVVVEVFSLVKETSLIDSPFWGSASLIVLFTYLLLVLMIIMTEITDYWLDVWIVTTERIINTEQHGLFNRVMSEVHVDQIQDITSEQKGFLATFLTFGDVFIQTAAERERFQFKTIDNPDDVKVAISRLASTCKTNHTHPHGNPLGGPVITN